jgi:hypothetical protein
VSQIVQRSESLRTVVTPANRTRTMKAIRVLLTTVRTGPNDRSTRRN